MLNAPDLQRRTVLYVDDEPAALKYFARGLEASFDVVTAESAHEARALMDARHDIAVVISDQRMAGETGVQLLTDLHHQRPDVIRMLTTAYSDIDAAVDAVNRGAIHKYLPKPWDLAELRKELALAIQLQVARQQRDRLANTNVEMLRKLVLADRARGLTFFAEQVLREIGRGVEAVLTGNDRSLNRGPENTNEASSVDAIQVARRAFEQLRQLEKRAVFERQTDADLRAIVGLAREDLMSTLSAVDAHLTVRIDDSLPDVMLDADQFRDMLQSLVEAALSLQHDRDEPAVTLWVRPFAGSLAVQILGESSALSETQLEKLHAPFVAADQDKSAHTLVVPLHVVACHGGRLLVHASPPAGPGFEVRLPAAGSSLQDVLPEITMGTLGLLSSGQ